MRRTLLVTVTMLGLAFSVLPAQAATSDDSFVFEGGGWGHGVGMPQYGAYGQALAGDTYTDILGYYYSGTSLSTLSEALGSDNFLVTEARPLWIGLEQSVQTITFEPIGGPLTVCQAPFADCPLPDVSPQAGESWVFEVVPDSDPLQCRFARVDPAPTGTPPAAGDCHATIEWGGAGQASRVEVDGTEYRRGLIRLRSEEVAEGFHLALEVSIQGYLYGLGEMPSSWSTHALRAQAVAARSYAVYKALYNEPTPTAGIDPGFSATRKAECWCHLYGSILDQNYVGYSKEVEPSGSRWLDAVDDTEDEVMTHPGGIGTLGSVIQAFYFSSSGGDTENSEDVFGAARPYLVSKKDGWSVAANVANPYASWSAEVAATDIAAAVGLDEVSVAELVAGPPGAVVRFTGLVGGNVETRELTGAAARALFGLRSGYITGVDLPGPPFTDIIGSVHYDDIAFIWREGITKGCNPPANTLYCPASPVTRGQMAAFLVRGLGLATAENDAFTDDAGNIFEDDINRLAAAGITKGCNPPANDRFCPNDPVTRGQMAAFLVRAFGYVDPGGGDHFVDDDGSIFEGDIDRLATARVTLGCNPPANDRFCPNDPVTRAQMASFLARALSAA